MHSASRVASRSKNLGWMASIAAASRMVGPGVRWVRRRLGIQRRAAATAAPSADHEESAVSTPQQPELRRSGTGATDQEAAELRAGDDFDETPGGLGPVPEANRPGHHPEHEQDKPEGPPA